MKEKQRKRADAPLLVPEQARVHQIYNDLLTSLTAGNTLEDACKALSLDVGTVRRDFLPSDEFRKQLTAFMAEQVTHAATALASLREPALNNLRMALYGGDDPRTARLAHRILRDLAGPARDLRRRPKNSVSIDQSSTRRKRHDRGD